MSQLEPIIQTLKNYHWGNNSGYDYVVAFLIFLGLLVVLKLFQVIILARLRVLAKKTKTDIDDLAIEIFASIKPPLYFFVSIYFAVKALVIADPIGQVINILLIVVIIYEIIRALEKLVDFLTSKQIDRVQESADGKKHSQSMVRALRVIIKISLWAVGLLLILSNLGVNITSLIAGLGIGGIAIALAIQNILSDVFSSFSLYLDKPFQIGDFIIVGTDMGTVEKIGLKTTRIRTLQGEELIISNKELTSVRVQNFKRMEKRRVAFNLGIVYGTKSEKLEKIPTIIEEVVKNTKGAEFDRCHFKSYGDFSLNFEVVYYVDSAEYEQFMNINQQVNLEIYKSFAKEKIEFAYPTQSVILEKK